MLEQKHDDILFHAYGVETLKNIYNYIKDISGEFKEQFIKCNDNKKFD